MKLRAVIAEAIEQALQQQSDQANLKAWMAPREAAEYLGCTTQHLQMLRARRAGPSFVKFGRLIRYARQDLDSYLSERKVETKS
jgi:excisionase family DNA binding protein